MFYANAILDCKASGVQVADSFVNEHVVHRQRFYTLSIFEGDLLLSGFFGDLFKPVHLSVEPLLNNNRKITVGQKTDKPGRTRDKNVFAVLKELKSSNGICY